MSIHDNFRLIELPTEEVDGLNAIEKVSPFRECTLVWTGIGISNRNKMHILMCCNTCIQSGYVFAIVFVIFILCSCSSQQSYIEVQKLK